MPSTVASTALVAASIVLIAALSTVIAMKGWPGSATVAEMRAPPVLAEPHEMERPVQRVVVGRKARRSRRPSARTARSGRSPAATRVASANAALAPDARRTPVARRVPASAPALPTARRPADSSARPRRPAAAPVPAPAAPAPPAAHGDPQERTAGGVAEAVGDALLHVRDALP